MLWHAISFDGWLIVHQYLSGCRDLELADQFSIQHLNQYCKGHSLNIVEPSVLFYGSKIEGSPEPYVHFSENPGILPGNQILTIKNDAH